MQHRSITAAALEAFEAALLREEKGRSTREYYLRAARRLTAWLDGRALSKEAAIAYREELERQGYRTASINTIIAALNSFFRFMGWEDCRLKTLRAQRKSYCLEEQELEPEDLARLVEQAERAGKDRLAMILMTLAATGVRVSELRFITVEALARGYAMVKLKGKTRPVILLEQLRVLLRDYVQRKGIREGPIFITRSGRPVDRSNVWREMKQLGEAAGVSPKKVYPHNFRHFFARLFYELQKDIAKLADVLGHSSVDTTRCYIITSWKEHRQQLERLGAILFGATQGHKKIPPGGGFTTLSI